MGFVKKYPLEIIASLVIILLFIFSRIYNVTSLPIFTDEAIYLRWAQIAKNDANWRFISLTDGKQPLFIWFVMLVMKFINDPLLAGRLVSVGAGLATTIGIFFLSKELFRHRWIGILSSFLYVIFPMALVYDRMALYDSLVAAFAVWGLYLAVLLVKKIQLDIALILGMVIGGGVLTKTSGFFTLYLLPFTLVLFNREPSNLITRFLKWIGLALVVAVLTYGFYALLRLSPFFHIVDEKNALFVYPFKEWIKHPFTYFIGNIQALWDWFTIYFSLPLLVLVVISFLINRKYFLEKTLLVIWFLVPFIALALFGNNLYPRFIFFMTTFLIPLAALSIWRIFYYFKNKYIFVFFLLCGIGWLVISDYFILFNFAKAPIPYSDVSQYNNDWPSGAGIKESVVFFTEQAKNQKIFIGTQGTFGLMPYAYELYLLNNKNIILKGFWPISETVPKELIEMSKKMPTFFVFHQACPICPAKGHAPQGWVVTPVLEIQKFAAGAYLAVYKINSQ